MLLRIVRRSFEAASIAWVQELPAKAPTPRPTPRFKKVLRSIPCERIETSIVVIDELFYRAFCHVIFMSQASTFSSGLTFQLTFFVTP